ncbi:MAG: penicillin-binding protein 2 [Eubacterium sp.]|nr:penicillin-binding protein 2 [Eubacterium sp.]
MSKRKNSRSSKSEKRKLNKQTWVVTVFFSIIFFFMIGYYVYFIVADSQEVASNSYNKRVDDRQEKIQRGTIYASHGEKLAYSDPGSTGNKNRHYPYGKTFAHVVGISTHGKSGLEKSCNFDLLSTRDTPFQEIINDFKGTKEKGADVYTTLKVGLQKDCYNALGDRKGAVFAMNPKTGAVLACVSRPSYNPETIDSIWKKLAKDSKDSRLVNRGTQGKYTPGSIFKTFTALEFMKEDSDFKDFKYNCHGYTKVGKDKIHCFDGKAHYNVNLRDAYAYSCNSAFATIGRELNMNKFRSTCETALFNKELPLDIESTQSKFNLDSDSSEWDIASTSIGQGTTTVSPAHMCMVASAIYNKGVLMKPYLVDSVVNSYDVIVKTTDPDEYKEIIPEENAKKLKSYMRSVCKYGTANMMAYSSYKAYGKTGTAELNSDDDINSWFMGFAKKGKKKIAIAVCLEDIKQGSGSATSVAKEIFDEYFN